MDTLIHRFENLQGSMTADEIVKELQKMKGHEQKEWQGESTYNKETSSDFPSTPITHRAPTGAFPGRVGRASTSGTVPRTQTDKERARRFGFTPARLMILTDGSDMSHKAIEAALHYRRRNDFIYFVTCVPLSSDKSSNLELTNKAKHVMDHVQEIIAERELGRWETAILPANNPQQAVVDYAYNNNIDFIFIGTRGIDESTGDFHPDSFSKHILHNSHCSVMLIR